MKKLKDIFKSSPFHWKLTFWICFVTSIGLIITSFFLPPKGQIDPSILQAVGELIAFPTLFAAYECIIRGIDIKYTKGDTTIETINPDKDV